MSNRMKKANRNQGNSERRGGGGGESDELKIHISRVPTKFDESIVLRILTDQLLSKAEQEKKTSDNSADCPIQVELVYPRESSQEEDETTTPPSKKKGSKSGTKTGNDDDDDENNQNHENTMEDPSTREHRGFGFVTFQSKDIYDKALTMSTIRGGRKPGSKKLSTMYLRPYTTSPGETNLCFLWVTGRCPYGEECKFSHTGAGGCIVIGGGRGVHDEDEDNEAKRKKKGKCFAFKKGKCEKGDDCPFSHDFEPSVLVLPTKDVEKKEDEHIDKITIPKSEKNCINWKTKAVCRKGEKCPYLHDPEILKKLMTKKKRKRQTDGNNDNNDNDNDDHEGMTGENTNDKKRKQPLCIRVFGMAYDTTEQDIRNFFQDCGPIHDITFPTFEDSGRSKGYCGIHFTSPKAVEKAIELDGHDLFGRWLSIQVGKMYLKEWESNHHVRSQQQQQQQEETTTSS